METALLSKVSFDTGSDPSKSAPSPYAVYVNDIAALLSRAESCWLTAVQIEALATLAEAFGHSSTDFLSQLGHDMQPETGGQVNQKRGA